VLEHGAIVVGERPGIGVDVVEDEVRRWAKPGEPVFDADPVIEAGR
jgi:L-alanine-DL-glutamate epimerase-like enolase superfamily enzyme